MAVKPSLIERGSMSIQYRSLILSGIFICINLVANTASAGATVFANNRSVVHKGSSGVSIAWPDVCKTPLPGGPVPIPYPNIVNRSQSEYPTGKKQTKKGKTVSIKQVYYKTKAGTQATGYRVEILGRSGRPMRLVRSTLFQLRDGSYCAVCVRNGKITRVLKMHAVAKPRIIRKRRAVRTRRPPVRNAPIRR